MIIVNSLGKMEIRERREAKKIILRKLQKWPFFLLLIAVWWGLRASGYSMGPESPVAIGLVIASVVILVLEFTKSGDIMLRAFMLDVAYLIVALVATASLMTLIIKEGKGLGLADFFVGFTVLIDAFLCPVNSFKMGLRNLQANMEHGPEHS